MDIVIRLLTGKRLPKCEISDTTTTQCFDEINLEDHASQRVHIASEGQFWLEVANVVQLSGRYELHRPESYGTPNNVVLENDKFAFRPSTAKIAAHFVVFCIPKFSDDVGEIETSEAGPSIIVNQYIVACKITMNNVFAVH